MLGAQVAAGRQAPQLNLGNTDTLTLTHVQGRALQQITSSPVVTTLPPPPPVAPPPPAPVAPAGASPAGGYYDILAGSTVCGAVVPDWNHYGACSEGVANTLNRVSALSAQGCKAFNLDLYSGEVSQNAANNATTMSNVAQVVNLAGSLNMKVLVGPSKDDATMTDRVPGADAQALLVALATQFAGNTNVGLNAGGQPHNEDGSQTAAIAAQYGLISAAVRGTGYKGLITFPAPQEDGRTGLNYFVPTANRIQDPNMRFLVTPYSTGNSSQSLSWLQPCAGTLPCAVVTGVQVNGTLDIDQDLTQATAQVNFANANHIPSFVTPWDNAAILSDQGESVMLGGNACQAQSAAVKTTVIGQQLINLQKGVTG